MMTRLLFILLLLTQGAIAAVISPGGTSSSSSATTLNGSITSTNTIPVITISARGIANGLSAISNDGAQYGPDTSGTLTCGIQEALNSIPRASSAGFGTNLVGATLQFGSGDFYYTNEIYYSNGAVSHIILDGAGFSSRLIYAGGRVETNLMLFIGRANSGGGSLHFDAHDLTFSTKTNGRHCFLTVSNAAHQNVLRCNFTGWQVTTNTDWGAGVSIPANGDDPPGGVGVVLGNGNDHACFVTDCYFANLACGLDLRTDHFYGQNIKFADIGFYGGGSIWGTLWPNTSPYSLGAAYLRPVSGLDTHIFRTHFYGCNVGVAVDSGSPKILLKEPQYEGCDYPVAAFNSATEFLFDEETANGDDGPIGRYAITHGPYALSGPSATAVVGRYVMYNNMLANSPVNGNQNAATNFTTIRASTISATGAITHARVSLNSLAGWNNSQELTNVGALQGLAISTDAATLVTNFNVWEQAKALAPTPIATNGTWVMREYVGAVQNVQLQNGNRFTSPIGVGSTGLVHIVGVPLPSSGYLSNLTVRCSTNNFSTTNYTFTLLTNNAAVNPVPTPVASLLTTTLLGVTGVAVTNGSGVSCILPTESSTVRIFGVMQILNSVANTTQPQTFSWRFEHWRQIGSP